MAALVRQDRAVAWLGPRRRVVLVHQMGRVGSMSVYAALRAVPGVLPVHVHFLSPTMREAARREARSASRPVPDHVREGALAAWFVRRNRTQREALVVTLVRDPVAFVLSDLFHNEVAATVRAENGKQAGPEDHADPEDYADPEKQAEREEQADAVAQLARERLAAFDPETDYMARWMREELYGVHGVDVLAEGFAPEVGWRVYGGTASVRVAVFRLEDAQRVFVPVMRGELGVQVEELGRTNAADQRPYAALYAAVTERLALPDDVLDRIYGAPFAQTLYSPEEIAGFRQKWGAGKAATA
jgi:hypothetical protein